MNPVNVKITRQPFFIEMSRKKHLSDSISCWINFTQKADYDLTTKH